MTTTIRSSHVFLVCSLIAIGCAERPDVPNGVSTTVDTIGEIPFIRNAGLPEQWVLAEQRTLGSSGFESELRGDEFGRITGVVADGEGNIYVADATAGEIRVFDSGQPGARRIGRQGAGPAEYGTPQSIGWLGDTLAVLDPGNGRLGLFSQSGEWLGHRPYMALSGANVRLFSTGIAELYMPFVSGGSLVLVRQTLAGPTDTLGLDIRKPGTAQTSEFLQRSRELSVTCSHSAGRGISSYKADLAPRAIVVPAPNGERAAVWSSEYRIAFVGEGGDTTRVIERDLPIEPLTDEQWVEEERKFREFLDQFSDESCDPRTLPRPDARQMILDLTFDDAGRLWVERETGTGRALDVFALTGELLASLDSPVRLDRVPIFVRGEALYLVVRDSLDVEFVKAYAVQGTAH